MQTHAGRHKQKLEVDLTTVTVPVVFSFLSGKGFCCHFCSHYMQSVLKQFVRKS